MHELDFAKAPYVVINGLNREELIAANSMILHEIYFDGLGGAAERRARRGARARFREHRTMVHGVRGDWKGGGRELRLGDPFLFSPRQAARQPMGCRADMLFHIVFQAGMDCAAV